MNRSLAWKIVLGAVGLTAICLVILSLSTSAGSMDLTEPFKILQQAPVAERSSMKRSTSAFWRSADMLKDDIPQSIQAAAAGIPVVTAKLTMTEGPRVFYQYSVPAAGSTGTGQFVLLLHGAAFSSQNWKDIGTLGLLAAMGHTAIAVDIPGYGKSTGKIASRDTFVASLIQQLRKSAPLSEAAAGSFTAAPVLVSPSMSGGFSIPVLLAEAAAAAAGPHTPIISAYVPVAPVATEQLSQKMAEKIKIPTLILYGSQDSGLGRTSLKNLSPIPTSHAVEIPNAGHPAYISQPDYFHKLLYNFLNYLNKVASPQ